MSRKMKGGSVASDAVVELVQPVAFDKLDVQFDNLVGGSKKTKSVQQKGKQQMQKKKKQDGGVCFMCGGRMKHMNEYDSEGIFNLHNKKGGAAPAAAAPAFEVKYDYTASMAKDAHGIQIDRGLDNSTVSLMATESPSSFGGMNKMVQYGNVFGDTNNIPFSYSGGATKKKAVKKPKATKAKTETKKAKPTKPTSSPKKQKPAAKSVKKPTKK